MLENFEYGIVEGNKNHIEAELKDERGSVVARIDIPDLKALDLVFSEAEVFEVLGKIGKRFDSLYESFPENMYKLNISKECWNEIAESVIKKLTEKGYKFK